MKKIKDWKKFNESFGSDELDDLYAVPEADRNQYVLVVQDPFNSFYDADIVFRFIQLIEKLGFKPVLLPFKPNGKPSHIKGFLTKEVDLEHESGIFSQVYKFGDRVSSIISEINPNYCFPKTLVFTILESSLLQNFNSQHLPGMLDAGPDSSNRFQFFYQLVTKAIQ